MNDKKIIILASNSKHKQKEFARFFTDRQVLIPSDLGLVFDVEEYEQTFIGNALLKAEHLYKMVKQPVLADDSGLVIEALPHILGVHSARFEEHKSQAQKNEEVLRLMRHQDNRRAYYVCALVLYQELSQFMAVQESWHGNIALEAAGDFGFGYDPIFCLSDGRTAAELQAVEKDKLSHRARALLKLNEWNT